MVPRFGIVTDGKFLLLDERRRRRRNDVGDVDCVDAAAGATRLDDVPAVDGLDAVFLQNPETFQFRFFVGRVRFLDHLGSML